jgi:ubiquitin carboxyl-terminal hydrolase 10
MQNGYFMNNGFQGYGGEPPNGDADNFHPNMNPYHQQFYPPDHPNSRGGGIGYQHPMQQQQQYGGFRQDGFMPAHQPHHMPMPSKGLNPAAQGFQYQPRKPEAVASGSAPNGDAPSVSSATPEIIAPVPEKPGAGGSLGLSLEPAAEPEPVPEKKEEKEAAPEPATEDPKETAPPVDEAKASAQASKAPSEAPEPTAPVPQTDTVELAPAADKKEDSTPEKAAAVLATEEKDKAPKGLTFTGASLAGVTSPKSAPSRRPRAYTHDPIRIRPSCPSPEVQGNSYNYRLAKCIPENVAVEHIEGRRRRRSSDGRSKPQGKAVLAFGTKGGRPHPDVSLVFGEITSAPATPVVTSPVPTPAPAPRAAPPAAKAKPSSWASLLRPAGATPVGSAGPSSTLVSPSKTNVSLPSEAPETPRSTAPSLPPSHGPAPAKPRPACNYAAAAAVGAPLSPAEDLARLLTEGLRTRSVRPAQPIRPRGLINTGNMCFANTVS